ncbi:hypothetical protein E6P78_11215 [Streptomyces sp. A0958]|uniref:carboxyl transferase domain-containing protein n=1 Tax=Streptomyces sp. A0958 TaxID=2563101 RepID=UPI00109EA34E|nr:carboxyl transferase domain-containing protein [Streptomyces sp. A0958]THA69996.1 hypothetical protein E6P78_11215 [Streptomyces sp. A0958]
MPTALDRPTERPADARGRVAELRAVRAQAVAGPSARATEAQHAKGKLTARERIELLVDPGSFHEVEQLRRHRATGFGLEAKRPYTDGVITGWGMVEGRTVFVYAHDFRIFGALRKAYGGAYIVMESQSIGADLTYAWPTNETAVMGAEGAANVTFRRQIANAEDPEAARAHMVKEYKSELMHPYYAAERGLVDDVIDPAGTREVLIKSLAMLRTKHADLPPRKHGNQPQ